MRAGPTAWTRLRVSVVLGLALAAAAGTPAVAQPPSSTSDPAEVAERLIGATDRSGYRLVEAAWVRLAQGGDHLVAVYSGAPLGEAQDTLYVIAPAPAGGVVARITDNRFRLGIDARSGVDHNGDGRPELVVKRGCGGTAWICEHLGLYHLATDGRLVELTAGLGDRLAPHRLTDLDNDGRDELIALDTSWETYDGLPHPQAPFVDTVLAWDGARYVVASDRFPDHFRAAITEIQTRLVTAPTPYDVGAWAVRELLNYQRLGEAARGAAVFELRLAELARQCGARRDCVELHDRLRDDFLLGVSPPPE